MSACDCVLITDDYLPHIGGSRLYCHRVASLLEGRISVLTRRRPGWEDFDSRAAYPVLRVHLGGGLLPGPAIVGEAYDAVAMARGALRLPRPGCYLAGEVMPSAFAAALAGRLSGLPYGVILHDEPLSGAGRFEGALRRRVLGSAAAIIASSSFPARRAREVVGEGVPVFVVPPGVDTAEFSPGRPDAAQLARLGVAPGGFLLCVGRLVDYKNVQAVIRALADLGETGLSLVVVGQGPYRGTLERLAEALSLRDRVVFAGRLATSSLVGLYRGALGYVFASRRSHGRQHEGVGMAALEAAACGCAVIASSQTSACDFVEEARTGLVFDPAREGSLERAIGALVSSPARRRQMALCCLEEVRRHFTWEAAAAGAAEAIGHIAPARSRRDASSCLA